MNVMNKIIVALLLAIFVFVALFLWYRGGSEDVIPVSVSGGPEISAGSDKELARGLETKTNSEGPVEVSVTPRRMVPTDTEWSFEISLDTHSYDLNDDLLAASELRDEQGNAYKPVAWDGDPPGGHHRGGVLKFKAIAPQPSSIMLAIQDVGGVKERKFTWQLTD